LKDKTMMQDDQPVDQSDGQILHPGSRQLFSYWEKLRAERACPSREEFDFAPIKTLLPDIVVIERDHLRNSFRFRLSGTRVCTLFNSNLTASDVLYGWDSFETDVISRHLLTVVNQKQPAVIRMRLTTDRHQTVAAELVALPVHMRGSSRVQIIGGVFPFRPAQSMVPSPIVQRELVSARVIWTEHEQTDSKIEPLFIETRAPNSRHHFTLIEGGKD
jgi:hypothetical protein